MATYFFETITAARALCAISLAAPVNFAPEGGGGGAGDGSAADAAAEPAAQAAAAAPAVAAAPPAARGKKLVSAIVRRGTVVVGDHGSEVHVGPGGQVTLPEADVVALRASGVLHDPDSDPLVPAGPTVDNDLVEPKVKTPAKPRKR